MINIIDASECLFCKIADGKVQAHKVYEDADAVAFLDINPAAPGHTLVVPKQHAADIFDIDEISLRRLIGAVKHVATKMKNALDMDLTIMQNNGRASGQIVEHIHFHLIPRSEGDGIGLMRGRVQMTEEQFKGIVEKIKEARGE